MSLITDVIQFYKGLRASRIPESVAKDLTVAYIQATIMVKFQLPPDEKWRAGGS